MSGGGLSKLGIALTIIFVISLVALLAELFYVLWRRRVFRRKNPPPSDREFQLPQYSSSDSWFPSAISSKDLLYFFCVRSQPRIELNSISPASSNAPPETEVIDVWKLQRMCGPPRFLFTIKEEEKEDLESVAEKSLCSSAEKESNKSNSISIRERVTLKECLEVVEEPPKAAMVVHDHGDGGGVRDEAEFPTPCDSPMYFTPLASPIHEEVNDR
ncbi:Hypothetical predicted protein [Olea europaea subsp. europaea]|uniref:Uncharacterized protein n=1 Tax=Olea europaea subsp. europaea TaxID=158383 RepID=A0A8S0QLL4_OLEEU|nr:Hypothetical predicted protein [Olea europaea subsp. europaea]